MKLLTKLYRWLTYTDRPLTPWQQIFSQSKVNGAKYYGDSLPVWKWAWPRRDGND